MNSKRSICKSKSKETSFKNLNLKNSKSRTTWIKVISLSVQIFWIPEMTILLLAMMISLKPKLKLTLVSSKIGKMWLPNNFRLKKKSTEKTLGKCSSRKVKWRENSRKTLKSPSKSWISNNFKQKNHPTKMNTKTFQTLKVITKKNPSKKKKISTILPKSSLRPKAKSQLLKNYRKMRNPFSNHKNQSILLKKITKWRSNKHQKRVHN